MKNIKTNQAKEEKIALYEIGRIFLNKQGEINKNSTKKETLFFQEKNLAIALAMGQLSNDTENLFSQIKSIITYLLNSLDMEIVFEQARIIPIWLKNSVTAAIYVNNKEIGYVSILNKNILSDFGIKKQTAIAEIDFTKLNVLAQKQKTKQFMELPKYPQITRDLAFVLNEKILYNDIKKQIINFSDLIKQVELFDIYQGDKLGFGKKSLAFHIIYQADRTLTSEEIDETQEKLIKYLEYKLEAKIRDF